MNVETLAMELHEAGREAVAQGATLNPFTHMDFVEWDKLPEHAKEGRRIQARYLLSRWDFMWKLGVMP